MILVPDQHALLYLEDGHVVGAFIGETEGDGMFLSWSIMSRPGALIPALREAIARASDFGWTHATFYIPDSHPRVGELARVALKRYHAEPVSSDERGVFYRISIPERRQANGRKPAETAGREGTTGPRSGSEQEEGSRGALEAPGETRRR